MIHTALRRNTQRYCAWRAVHPTVLQRERPVAQKNQVITSDAQLAAIFGQRVVTSNRRREAAEPRHRQHWASLARSHEHLADGSARPLRAVLFNRARWKLPARIGYLISNANSLVRPRRLRLILKYLSSNSLHAAGIPSSKRTLPDTMSYTGATVQSPWNRSTSARVSPSSWTRVYPVDKIVQRLMPSRKLQRLGGLVILRRSADSHEDFHEKLMESYAPLENADPELLSLFGLTLLEWNMAPPRRANTIIAMDEYGRTGLEYAQSANHTKKQIGKWLETVTRRSRAARRWSRFVIKQDSVWATFGENGEPTASTPLSPSGHRIGCIAFGQENFVRVSNSARSVVIFRFMSDSRLRDVGEEVGSRTNGR